jgi:O-antigen/teichoic acid export membrane protein
LKAYASLTAFTFAERVAGVLVYQADGFISAKMISNHVAAVYSMTGRAFDPVRMATDRFGPAFLPSLAHLSGEGNRARVAEVSGMLLRVIGFVLAVGIGCVIALNKGFVTVWVGPHLFGGQWLTVAMGLAVASTVTIGTLGEMIFALGGIGKIEIVRMIENVVQFTLKITLLNYFGLIGLPLGMLAGTALVGAWYIPRIAARLMQQDLGLQYRRLAMTFLRIALMAAIGYVVSRLLPRIIDGWTWPRFIACAVVVGTIFGGIGLLIDPYVRKTGFATAIRMLRSRRQRVAADETSLDASNP